ncbi:MAG: Mrp/NBP35 family ATP-binding protein [Planctomycetota bacterium]
MPEHPTPGTVTKAHVVETLRRVVPSGQSQDIVSLNVVQRVEVSDTSAEIEMTLPAGLAKQREPIRAAVESAVRELGLDPKASFTMQLAGGGDAKETTGGGEGFDASASNNPLPDVKHVIAVGAGKGGVGKSTVALNLAVGLARSGKKVGLLDGDIYGPSLPTMLGTDRYEVRASGKTLIPFELHGIKAMTLGALVEDDKPLIWRGPMAHGAFKQLATQTDWGTLDYLIVDLPPGTGDVPLTLAQTLPLSGAVVVCTPQKVAQDDARRAVAMFRQLQIEVLGVVENMSYFVGDDGKEYDLFGRGGAEMLATQMGLPYLGGIPINTNLRANGDAGDPTANFTNDDALAADLDAFVKCFEREIAVVAMGASAAGPSLTIR